jgi:hypothetical protein
MLNSGGFMTGTTNMIIESDTLEDQYNEAIKNVRIFFK